VCVTDNNNNENSDNNKVGTIGHKETKTNKQKAGRGTEGRSDGGEELDEDTNTGGTRRCTAKTNREQDTNPNNSKEAAADGSRDELEEEESEGEWELIGGRKMTDGPNETEERPNRISTSG
jgi:hypothetical protein